MWALAYISLITVCSLLRELYDLFGLASSAKKADDISEH